MQHTVTITIPEMLEPRIQGMKDFDLFVSTITIDALQQNEPRIQRQQLAEAAQRMLHEYQTNHELTSFTALDREPIYE